MQLQNVKSVTVKGFFLNRLFSLKNVGFIKILETKTGGYETENVSSFLINVAPTRSGTHFIKLHEAVDYSWLQQL